MRHFSRFLFYLICAVSGLVIVGYRSLELIITILMLLVLQAWVEKRVPPALFLRSCHIGRDHDHEVISTLCTPLSATHRCLWLHHEGHGQGRLLNDILHGITEWKFNLLSVLILLAWWPTEAVYWPSKDSVLEKLLILSITILCARATAKLLKDNWDTGYANFVVFFSLAGTWSLPTFSREYLGAMAVSYVITVFAANLMEQKERKIRPGFWYKDHIRVTDDVYQIYRTCARQGGKGAVSSFPRRLYDLEVESAMINHRWEQVIKAALSARPLVVMDVSGYEHSQGLQWELKTARHFQAPTILVFPRNNCSSMRYVCAAHNLALDINVIQMASLCQHVYDAPSDAQVATIDQRKWPVIILEYPSSLDGNNSISTWIFQIRKSVRLLEKCGVGSENRAAD